MAKIIENAINKQTIFSDMPVNILLKIIKVTEVCCSKKWKIYIIMILIFRFVSKVRAARRLWAKYNLVRGTLSFDHILQKSKQRYLHEKKNKIFIFKLFKNIFFLFIDVIDTSLKIGIDEVRV